MVIDYKKWALAALLVLAMLIAGYILLWLNQRQPTARELGSGFNQQVYISIAEHGLVNFDEITDFDWDYLVILGPYTSVANALEYMGFSWHRPVTHVQHSDVQTLLLFVNNNQVVAFTHIIRARVDFTAILREHGNAPINKPAILKFN